MEFRLVKVIGTPAVDGRPLALQFDAAASPLLYLGEALPGTATNVAGWRIMRFDVTAGVQILWADGDELLNNVWDDRASLSYS
jgi:hypothetical protein